MDQQQILHRPFDITTHKKTFINYLEVIMDKDGVIMYAIPSHQEKLISIACDQLKISRDELYKKCPEEYYFSLMEWLCEITGCIALWNEHKVGIPNEKQERVLDRLTAEGLFNDTNK